MNRPRAMVVLCSMTATVCSPPPPAGDDVGVVMVAITAAPADVSCVQIRGEGVRAVVRSFDTTPGASTVFKMSGVPLGALTLSGQAFASPCAGVTAASDPTWVADAVATTVVAGVAGSVTLTMRRNGTLNVGVDFVDDTPPPPDPNCNTVLAKVGAACTQDCAVACGFGAIGTKTCTCIGGVYASCPCPRPAEFMGAATAPLCATPDGTTTSLRNTPCATEWDECIGTDPVSGTTPQGCVCMLNTATGALTWTCGSTNKWFSLDPTAP